MTHATQLALMVVWLGVEGEQAKHAAWDAMSGEVEWATRGHLACNVSEKGNAVRGDIGSPLVSTRFPSCPACCVLLDMAREVAP